MFNFFGGAPRKEAPVAEVPKIEENNEITTVEEGSGDLHLSHDNLIISKEEADEIREKKKWREQD